MNWILLLNHFRLLSCRFYKEWLSMCWKSSTIRNPQPKWRSKLELCFIYSIPCHSVNVSSFPTMLWELKLFAPWLRKEVGQQFSLLQHRTKERGFKLLTDWNSSKSEFSSPRIWQPEALTLKTSTWSSTLTCLGMKQRISIGLAGLEGKHEVHIHLKG